ncbi:MAG: TetR/AcrR family transcriptional regulator [Actinomycetota bacterium]|nr:TetR/AcrR family transcriptional regulator [Actinomycetota bacterium]
MDAALRVFAEHGFHKATIKRIAGQAQLRSPALIYWYFTDKVDLFRAAILERAPILKLAASPESLLEAPPRQALLQVARTYYRTFDDPVARRLMRVLLSEATRNREVARHFAERGPMAVLRLLSSYLQRQVELGRLRPHDPETSARCFGGMLLVYLLGQEIFPPIAEGLPDADRYAEEVVSIFLDGLSTEEA